MDETKKPHNCQGWLSAAKLTFTGLVTHTTTARGLDIGKPLGANASANILLAERTFSYIATGPCYLTLCKLGGKLASGRRSVNYAQT